MSTASRSTSYCPLHLMFGIVNHCFTYRQYDSTIFSVVSIIHSSDQPAHSGAIVAIQFGGKSLSVRLHVLPHTETHNQQEMLHSENSTLVSKDPLAFESSLTGAVGSGEATDES